MPSPRLIRDINSLRAVCYGSRLGHGQVLTCVGMHCMFTFEQAVHGWRLSHLIFLLVQHSQVRTTADLFICASASG